MDSKVNTRNDFPIVNTSLSRTTRMTTRKRKLPPDSNDAQLLLSAIKDGATPLSHTASEIFKLDNVEVAQRLKKIYTVRSINGFLNNRRRSASLMGKQLFHEVAIFTDNCVVF